MAMKPKGLLVAAGLAVVAVAVSAGSLFAQQAQVAKPVAAIDIVAVPANINDPDAIVGVNGLGRQVAEGTSGLDNVSVQVPVTLQGSAADPKAQVTKYTWALSAPTASKSKLDATDQAKVKFTPDVSGIYKVDLTVTTAGGTSDLSSVQIHAGEYIGAGTGNCFQCHPQKTDEWSKTPHATLFKDEINGGENPRVAEYGKDSEGCVRCHTTGYYIGAQNGGYPDVVAKTGYQLPPNADVMAAKDNWANVPAAVQNMATIGCEDCHGPAKDHVQNSGKMAVSLDDGVCNACHNGGGHHIKGQEFQNSAHGDKTSMAWTYPIGPAEQDCVRCHSGKGFITFLQNPTNPAAWDNTMQNATCAVCHDPHSDANAFQLRVTGKPVAVPGVDKDFALSTVCAECHNARTTASVDAAKGSFPHYSAAAEMLADTGGVTYGQTVSNSPHGMVVGAFPVLNPDPAAESPLIFGGNVPGPCVACHMEITSANPKDPNQYHVGGHSFNAVNPDNGTPYTESCQACHEGITTFNIQAKADFDGNGKVEGVQNEVAGLLTKLQQSISDSGIKPVKGYPYFDQSNKANWTMQQKNAIYNFLFVRGTEDNFGKASAIHNFNRSVSLLQKSYKDLTGKDVPGATMVQ